MLNLATSGFTANNFTGATVTDLENSAQDDHVVDVRDIIDFHDAADQLIFNGDSNDTLAFADDRQLIEMEGTVSHSGRTYNHYAYGVASILVDTDVDVIAA